MIRRWSPWYHELKRDSSELMTCCQSECWTLCSWAHYRSRRRWFSVKGIIYKGVFARSLRCNRHYEQMKQRQWYNCPNRPMCCQLFRWSCAIRPRHAKHMSYRALTSLSGTHPIFSSCLILDGLLLPNSDHSAAVNAAYELLLHNKKILLYEGRWFFQFQNLLVV